MILSRHFVYIHMPKTGGSFVRKVIVAHAPDDWELQTFDTHPPIHEIPESHRHLPVFAFVRNPFAWYVSWYHFLRASGSNSFFDDISQGGKLSFDESIRNAVTKHDTLTRGEGPYTQFLRQMLGPELAGVQIGRVENLRDDLLRILGGIVSLPAPMVEAIRAAPKVNVSKHAHYSTYYDADLRQLVEERDRPTLEYFGYRMEEPTT